MQYRNPTVPLAQNMNAAAGMMLWALVFAGGLFAGMLGMQHLGHVIAMRRIAHDPEGAKHGAGVVEGAVFGLLSLLIAFTFSGAVARFDDRRQLVGQEAILISTAWDRIQLLPADTQPGLRDLFRRYLDARLETYRAVGDRYASTAQWNHARELQGEIWNRGVSAASASPTTVAGVLFLPALNDMFDITVTRLMATQMHPPGIVHGMLATLALVGALLAGYHMAGSRTRSWLHSVGFALVLAATTYVILDIEYPRLGLIRVDASDEVLLDLRRLMN
jgi:hypothetical protein